MKSKLLLAVLLGAFGVSVQADELDNSTRTDASTPAGVLVKMDEKGNVLEAYKVEGNAKVSNDAEAAKVIASAASDANKITIKNSKDELDQTSSTPAWWWGGGWGWGYGIGYGYGWGGGWGYPYYGYYYPSYWYYPGYSCFWGGYRWGLWW